MPWQDVGLSVCPSARLSVRHTQVFCLNGYTYAQSFLPPDWKRPAGRPSHTWLRAIEADLGPLNFGLATAWRKATTRDEWRHIVDAATLRRSTL